jgi:hypothetical protein
MVQICRPMTYVLNYLVIPFFFVVFGQRLQGQATAHGERTRRLHSLFGVGESALQPYCPRNILCYPLALSSSQSLHGLNSRSLAYIEVRIEYLCLPSDIVAIRGVH